MEAKKPFIKDCLHYDETFENCPYCRGTGKIVMEWYYSMDGKIYRLKKEVIGQKWHGHGVEPSFTPVIMKKGSLVKVVMCSRFGDVGITPNLDVTRGYIARVDPEDLEEV